MIKTYTDKQNNQEHQTILNNTVLIISGINKIRNAMVRQGVNGIVEKEVDETEKKLFLLKSEIENHSRNSIELGVDDYTTELELLKKEVKNLKTIKIVGFILGVLSFILTLDKLGIITILD